MLKFRRWEWIALSLTCLLFAIAAPVLDYHNALYLVGGLLYLATVVLVAPPLFLALTLYRVIAYRRFAGRWNALDSWLVVLALVSALAARILIYVNYSDYTTPPDFAFDVLRALAPVLIPLWAIVRFVDFALHRQWAPAIVRLFVPLACVALFFAGRTVADYAEVRWASQSMAYDIDKNVRHVVARMIDGDFIVVKYVVFDRVGVEDPLLKQTVSNAENLCITDLRSIGDHFYLVSGVGKPCQ